MLVARQVKGYQSLPSIIYISYGLSEFIRSDVSAWYQKISANGAHLLQMEGEHSSLFLSQGLRVLAKRNNDAHLKSSCHMGNVYKSFYNPVGT